MAKLDITYTLKTTPEDNLKEVEIVFVPWHNSIFHIVKISRLFWDEEFKTRHTMKYKLINFSDSEQEKIKQLILKEWNRHLSFVKTDLYPINDSCQLNESTRV